MLKVNDVIAKVGEEYRPMLRQISIVDFTKCIAQFGGLSMAGVSDNAILNYLTEWCLNKKKFFDLFGGNTKVDIPFSYKDEDKDFNGAYQELERRYPGFYYWLKEFSDERNNKIDTDRHNWRFTEVIRDLFPRQNINNMAITTFFKRCLNAPDDLITEIGRIYENGEVHATFTLSIDPVDMMLASDNPYKWTSCYRLEEDFCESHADGSLAAILDTSSVITYVWNNEGKFNLYDAYDFKNVRYKRMREWISFSPNFTTIHFNTIYPGKANYSEGFNKMYRDVVENWISNRLGVDNKWKKEYCNEDYSCGYEWVHEYGYNEFGSSHIYTQSNSTPETISIYDREIECPCGCGWILPGTSSDMCEYDDAYHGGGHNHGNYYEEEPEGYYCNETGDYEDCDGDCQSCPLYNRHHAVCNLDENHYCDHRDLDEAEDVDGDFDPYDSNIITCNPDRCAECPLFRIHHPEAAAAAQEDNTEENTPATIVVGGDGWTVSRNDDTVDAWRTAWHSAIDTSYWTYNNDNRNTVTISTNPSPYIWAINEPVEIESSNLDDETNEN